MRRVSLGLFFLIFLISISGCQTVKGTAAGIAGVAAGVGGTAYVFGKGLAEDAQGTWEAVERADEWIKENCW